MSTHRRPAAVVAPVNKPVDIEFVLKLLEANAKLEHENDALTKLVEAQTETIVLLHRNRRA